MSKRWQKSFSFGKGSGKVCELTENVKTLLRQLKNDKAVISSSAEQIFPIFISQNRLKVFLPKRGWQIAKKKNKIKIKTKNNKK